MKKHISLVMPMKLNHFFSAHLAASEGHLHCLKYIISSAVSISNALMARNDQVFDGVAFNVACITLLCKCLPKNYPLLKNSFADG